MKTIDFTGTLGGAFLLSVVALCAPSHAVDAVKLSPETQANRERTQRKVASPTQSQAHAQAAKQTSKLAAKKPSKKIATKPRPALAVAPKPSVPAPTELALLDRNAANRIAEAPRVNPVESLELGKNLEAAGKRREAVIAYERAANAGATPASGAAAKRLGEIYDAGGDGVPRDYETALRWYEKARAAGEVIARPGVYRTVR